MFAQGIGGGGAQTSFDAVAAYSGGFEFLGDSEADTGITEIVGYGLQDYAMSDAFLALLADFHEIGALYQAFNVLKLVSCGFHGVACMKRPQLRADALAAFGTAAGQYGAALLGRHARTEPVTAFTDEFAWLIGTFHGPKSLIDSFKVGVL